LTCQTTSIVSNRVKRKTRYCCNMIKIWSFLSLRPSQGLVYTISNSFIKKIAFLSAFDLKS
jgi:hypothetical protein